MTAASQYESTSSIVPCCPISKYYWRRYWRKCKYQMYWGWQYISHCTNIGWIIYWYNFSKRLEWFYSRRCDSYQLESSWNNKKYRIFSAKIFNFKIIFTLRISFFLFPQGLTFTFLCAIPLQYPVGNIQRSADRVEYFTVAFNVRLWDHDHNGSLWIHPTAVINILPWSGNISITIQNMERELVLITFSWYNFLVGVDGSWLNSGVCPICCTSLKWVRNTYHEFYRPSYFSWQQDLGRLFYNHRHIHSDTFTKRSVFQFLCSHNYGTRILFAQSMPETIDWLKSHSTRVPNVCLLTDGETIWVES